MLSSEKLKEIDFGLKNENFRKINKCNHHFIFFQEVAKGNNNNKEVGVASNSNANLLTIMVAAVMAPAAVTKAGTTKVNICLFCKYLFKGFHDRHLSGE